ncbi:hypothetical protein TorRG33x02_284840 [Trema orientale]|uniref:Uncharacterized protein n=1 Tax=Trema orientale TaxID=63057 RepID=A0A2P5CHA4_TREOI|nr:hypothetical protein TorRG33x02_284840 [Trema orientale]
MSSSLLGLLLLEANIWLILVFLFKLLQNVQPLKKEAKDGCDKALEEKRKTEEKVAQAREAKDQLQKDLVNLRVKVVADVVRARGEAIVNFKNLRIYTSTDLLTIVLKFRPSSLCQF